MIVLGIESSCDETAVGIVEDGKRLLSNVVASSLALHIQYGGVVPEVAARSHIEVMLPVVQQALDEAGCDWNDIDAIAVTYGAGLLGSLMIGVLTARTLALALGKPLYGVNHVEGHIYANFLTEAGSKFQKTKPKVQYTLPSKQPEFPMLGVIISGGHTQLVLWRGHFDYRMLGQTRDDAIGEAFDKVARTLGLPYPGGISVSKLAGQGDPFAFKLPKAKLDTPYEFSFSGLKTAVLRAAQEATGNDYSLPSTALPDLLTQQQKADISASFQRVACDTLVEKVLWAYEEFSPHSVCIGGGVAANQELRRQLSERLPLPIEYTDQKLCTDNGAMVAALGCFHHFHQRPQANPLALEPKPNLVM